MKVANSGRNWRDKEDVEYGEKEAALHFGLLFISLSVSEKDAR